MHEKYNADVFGVGGGGGEYTPQIGFGWSNGVALVLINDTYTSFVSSPSSDSNADNTTLIIVLSVVIPVVVCGLMAVGVYFFFFMKGSSTGAGSTSTGGKQVGNDVDMNGVVQEQSNPMR
jgi:hypothetical protein